MAAIGGGEKVNLTAPDIAAALAPKEGRAPIMNKDLADVQKRMIKMGGKSVFEADTSQSEDDAMVNFDEMRRVMDDEQKRVDAITDPAKAVEKANLQKRQDRLIRRFSVYDKLLNNEGFGAMTAEEQREMMGVMADLPGFCESIAIATNNTLTIEQARKIMMGKGGVGLTPDQKKVIGEMVTQFANDDKLHSRLAKSLAKLKLPADDATDAASIAQKQGEIINEKVERSIFKTNNDIVEAFTNDPKKADRLEKLSERIDKIKTGLDDSYVPNTLDVASLGRVEARVLADEAKDKLAYESKVSSSASGKSGATAEFAAYQAAMVQTKKVQALLEMANQNSNLESEVDEYKSYVSAKTKRDAVEKNIQKIDTAKRDIAGLEAKRGTTVAAYKRRMEMGLSDEMKRYWNEVKLVQADQAAQAEAAKKAEIEAKDKEAKAKREALAKTVLDKYLHLSFLKYKGGKAVGWQDNDLKKFVKTDMLSRSPAQLTRDLLERVNTMRYNMPPAYAKEMKKMWDDAGIGTGTPPLTLKAALDEIGKDKWEEWAAEKIPDVLGYAYGRGYYFDRLRIKAGQAEFMRQAYSPEFFTKALEAKKNYADSASEMVNSGLLTGGAVNEAKIKEMLGGDWVNGSKRIMKTLAVAGAIGAGTFALTGGLGVTTPGIIPFDFVAGAGRSVEALTNTAAAVVQTASLASKATGAAISGVGGGVATLSNSVAKMIP